ncbi:PhzF family phenazine biosynthesis protein [Cyanobium sp. FGCU-52]|nr:PhzF family phenazine biosynthesis protein [Cyanobium sp. FGCU52]
MSGPSREPGDLPAVLVEAFADRHFHGNGAAVVRLDAPADDAWMQSLARSLNQSETAFLLRRGDQWLLRWFTPQCEVPLCGHATLGALLALGHWGDVTAGQPIWFHTRSGPLPVQLDAGASRRGSLELPSSGLRPSPVPGDLETLLAEHLATAAEAFWTSPLGYVVALLPAAASLAGPLPLAPLLQGDLRNGLVLMQPAGIAAAGEQVGGEIPDYRLRFFAPGLGIDEDPVTGSAHALVAPWWMERLGRRRVVGWQCSDRPGGMVCEGSSSGMIRLIGTGHLLWDGFLRTAPPPWDASSSPGSDAAERARRSWDSLLPPG